MGLLEIFLTGVGLSMDAFAVSICKGLEQKRFNILCMLVIAFLFGFFQFAMPVVAYFCCKNFAGYIESFDHWIAFGLLAFIGLKMIIECILEYKKEKKRDTNLETKDLTSKNSFNKENLNTKNSNIISDNQKINNTSNIDSNNSLSNENINLNKAKGNDKLNIRELLVLALATSIDALVVGITLAFTSTNIFLASGIIGIVTFVICCGGVLIGNFFGAKFKTSAGIIGGVILILIGLKILLEHLGILVI